MLDSCRMVEKQPEVFYTFLWHFFPSLKQNCIAYRSSNVSSRQDCIFETHQLWQSGFSRVYSNYCSSCSFEPEIIKIGQSSHKMYNNNILNFWESTTILNACPKKKSLETYWRDHIPSFSINPHKFLLMPPLSVNFTFYKHYQSPPTLYIYLIYHIYSTLFYDSVYITQHEHKTYNYEK